MEPVIIPRGYNLTRFIDRNEWSRRTVYRALQGTDGSQVSMETRALIRECFEKSVREWQAAQEQPASP